MKYETRNNIYLSIRVFIWCFTLSYIVFRSNIVLITAKSGVLFQNLSPGYHYLSGFIEGIVLLMIFILGLFGSHFVKSIQEAENWEDYKDKMDTKLKNKIKRKK